MENFLGRDGFVWFEGVVESRQDPLKLGRIKVRIFGWHQDDLSKLPTDDLPWALVAYPPGSTSPTPPHEGTYVWGYFRDSYVAQEPVVCGIFHGIPGPAD